MTDGGPPQRPEGRLLQAALERSGKSARQVAPSAGISDTRWRHIVNGYQPVGRGQRVTVVAPADTLARMALAVGVTAPELHQAGRADAAEVLQAMNVARGRLRPVFRGDIVRREDLVQFIADRSREITEAADQLARLDEANAVELASLAALNPGTMSVKEVLDAAQDEAGEAPDAPGPEHGA